jgi:hypothetical protein
MSWSIFVAVLKPVFPCYLQVWFRDLWICICCFEVVSLCFKAVHYKFKQASRGKNIKILVRFYWSNFKFFSLSGHTGLNGSVRNFHLRNYWMDVVEILYWMVYSKRSQPKFNFVSYRYNVKPTLAELSQKFIYYFVRNVPASKGLQLYETWIIMWTSIGLGKLLQIM